MAARAAALLIGHGVVDYSKKTGWGCCVNLYELVYTAVHTRVYTYVLYSWFQKTNVC